MEDTVMFRSKYIYTWSVVKIPAVCDCTSKVSSFQSTVIVCSKACMKLMEVGQKHC